MISETLQKEIWLLIFLKITINIPVLNVAKDITIKSEIVNTLNKGKDL